MNFFPRVGSDAFRNLMQLGAVVLSALALVIHSSFRRIGTDSAANLLVAQNLLDLGLYVSADRFSFNFGPLFDPTITTGPTVLLPIAAISLLTGDIVLGGRIVMAAFWFALSLSIYFGLRPRLGGWLAAVAALVPQSVNFTGRFRFAELQGASDIVGEIPAMFFVLLAIGVLKKSPLASGVFLALGLLTKLSFLVVLPAFAIAVLFIGGRLGWAAGTRSTLRFLVGSFLPVAIWEIYKLATLGAPGYGKHLEDFLGHLRSSGVHTGYGSARGLTETGPLIGEIFALSYFHFLLGVLWVVLILSRAFAKSSGELRSSGPMVFFWAKLEPLVVFAAGAGVFGWWIFLNDAHYSRTVVPAIVFCSLGLLGISLEGQGSLSAGFRERLGTLAIVAPVALGAFWALQTPITDSLDQQVQVNELIRTSQTQTFSYLQDNRLLVNDILTLGGVSVTEDYGNDLHVVSHPEEWEIPRSETDGLIQARCGAIVLSTLRHTVCEPKFSGAKSP